MESLLTTNQVASQLEEQLFSSELFFVFRHYYGFKKDNNYNLNFI